MKSPFELMIEKHAEQFKTEVNVGMKAFFYADMDGDIETVDEVQCFDWGFYYEFDGLPCAVLYTAEGLQDHSDIALNEQDGLDTFHGYSLHPTIDSVIAGILAGQADAIGDDMTAEQSQMLVDLHLADMGVFVVGGSETD